MTADYPIQDEVWVHASRLRGAERALARLHEEVERLTRERDELRAQLDAAQELIAVRAYSPESSEGVDPAPATWRELAEQDDYDDD